MGFSRQGYCSGLPFPSPGDLPNPGIEPRSPTLQADSLTSEPPGKPSHRFRDPKFGALDLIMHILTHQVIGMPTRLKSHSTTYTKWVKPNWIPLLNGVLVNHLTVCVLVTRSCTTLCVSMDSSPPGSSVHGILQARILGGLPCPPPGNSNPGIEPTSLMSPALAGRFFTTSTTWETHLTIC